MGDKIGSKSDFVWFPTSEYIEQAHLTKFMRIHTIPDFQSLIRRSAEDIAWFTNAILDYLDIKFYQPYSQVVDLSQGPQSPKWCLDGKINVVHNCLDKYIGTSTEDQTALIWEGEDGTTRTLTYGKLFIQVNKIANGLKSLQVKKGDAVGIFMPMIPEIVVALLAIAKIGAIIIPLFSGYGVNALVTRLDDAEVKVLFTADGFFRRGMKIAMKSIADQAVEQVESLKHIIVMNRLGMDVTMHPERDHWWHDLISQSSHKIRTEITEAEDILMILYTSGTSGRPKGTVHTHCGFPVKSAQDIAFGPDLHPGDILYWMTDMGWMMGPWLVFGSLILGSTFFIYEGAPDYPGPDRLWAMIERHRITTIGLSPSLIRALIPYGDGPVRNHDLGSLRILAIAGEPSNPEPWLWYFDKVGGGKLPIINYSGGTEVSGAILMGNPILPLKPCAFSGVAPGMNVDIFDETGNSIREKVGELVLKSTCIGTTRSFWNDHDRYMQTYWSRWKNIWVHGDFAIVDSDNQWYILGRSDDTIKVAGKRIGPAELESILINHPLVIEAAAVGVPHEIKGNEVVVFVVLASGHEPNNKLTEELRSMVITAMGKPFSPRKILFVNDFPRTRNMKIMRRMIRAAYLGIDPGDTSSLVNPQSMEEIQQAR